MLGTLLLGLREALQCSIGLILASEHSSFSERRNLLVYGLAAGFFAGGLSGFVHATGPDVIDTETWRALRHIFEIALLYSGVVLLALGFDRPGAPMPSERFLKYSAFAIGLILVLFESRTMFFFALEQGRLAEKEAAYLGILVAGLTAGFLPAVALGRRIEKAKLTRFFSLPGLVIAIGAVKFLTGGVSEVEDGNILVFIQAGFRDFLENAMSHLQSVIMISPHEFINTPFSMLASYISGDRVSTSLLVIFITIPPVIALLRLFSRPDPSVRGVKVAAEKRLRLAFFRREMIFLASPMILSVIILLTMLHAVNASLNPMSEPVPMPVKESEERAGELWLPLIDKLGDFRDGGLRKYLYFYGTEKIIFLAIMKPDGAVGVALDECEICKPAEWNTAAKGYAKRADTLVCKYCMTPIPISTINKPGGCNPIPFAFKLSNDNIVIEIEELIRIHKEAKSLDKKGTHL